MNVMTDFERLRKPTSISAYFDVVRFWVEDPLDQQKRAELTNLCGGKLRVDTEPARFSSLYRQRISLRQPPDRALEWLHKNVQTVFVNYVEIAMDWTFEDCASRDEAWRFINRHLVRRYHGKQQKILFCGDALNGSQESQRSFDPEQTRYDAQRSAPNRTVLYKDEVSRQTGEIVPLLHLEWRANGADAVRSLGIGTAVDLVDFKHRRFWEYRMLLLDASPGRLGRFVRNCINGKKSRTETLADRRRGRAILKKYETIQELIDALGRKYRVRRALTTIPNDVWLPERT
jgi:hypothetical protein